LIKQPNSQKQRLHFEQDISFFFHFEQAIGFYNYFLRSTEAD